MMQNNGYYLGIMSGTSTDAVDAVLAVFGDEDAQLSIVGSSSVPIDQSLRDELLALNHSDGSNELHRAACAANDITRLYAQAVRDLLTQHEVPAAHVQAIGAHGQTVRHRPDCGYTLQLINGALLAELSGIDVVMDFRSRDIAAGGQGAPLIPAFQEAVFGQEKDSALLNLGGIANLTFFDPDGTRGFDVGPGNMLMDAWCQQHTGEPFDRGGAWGDRGNFNADLLEFLIASEPWLALPPPKSTGRDLFNMQWLQDRLQQFETYSGTALNPTDVQATLRMLTVQVIAGQMQDRPVKELIVFGGGALNAALMREIINALDGIQVITSEERGIALQSMEALCFAWLARQFTLRQKICGPAMTGARHTVVAGCLYPA